MDNYEMARGHALVGLAGRAEGLGSSPLLCSGHNATLGHRALPHFTIGFSPKAIKHKRLTVCSCCHTGLHVVERNLKTTTKVIGLQAHTARGTQQSPAYANNVAPSPGLCHHRDDSGTPILT